MLKHGGDPNRATENGSTALHYAAARGNADVIRVLVAYKADLGAIDGSGNTPLMVATNNGHPEAVLALGGKL